MSPAKDSNLKEKMTVEVTYVNSKAEKKNEQVKFETVYKEDDSLNKGVEKVVQEGKNGKKVVEYKVTFENGKEKKRDVIKENVTSNKTDKVVVRGTKKKWLQHQFLTYPLQVQRLHHRHQHHQLHQVVKHTKWNLLHIQVAVLQLMVST